MINLKNLTLRRGAKVLLNDASVTLHTGEKVAIIGRNGAGKSSLFALITGVLHEDQGEFSFPKNWRIAQVAQDMPETEQSATDFVLAGDVGLIEAQNEVTAAEVSQDHERLAYAYTALYDAGSYDAKSRAQAIILGLGFKPSELGLSVSSFSGGWRMRLQLARALMCPSDLLLLDEPTNHLDLDALVWLEARLKKYTGTLLVISHDKEFLDAIVDVTLHLDCTKLNRYGGNYSVFEELRAQQLALQQSAFGRQQEQVKHLQKFIDRFKAGTKAKQAQSRVKALERMQKIAPILAEAEFNFEFMDAGQLPNPMLSMNNLSIGYQSEEEGKIGHGYAVVKDIGLSVCAKQRIGILGANGQGKSTLVKTIAQELPILEGEMIAGKGLVIGYFAQQELDVLRPDDTPLMHMKDLAKALMAEGRAGLPSTREQDLRSFLGSFSFTAEMVNQTVGSMSGGEKARLVLCMLVWQRPNLLLLDEPTNHLDLTTREALALALNEFEGTVMLVSHDRSLLRSTCEEFLLVADGKVKPFVGDMDDYQAYLLEAAKKRKNQDKSEQKKMDKPMAISIPTTNSAPKRSLASPKVPQKIVADLAKVEEEIGAVQQKIKHLQDLLSNVKEGAEIVKFSQELQQTETQQEQLENRWYELTTQIEQIKNPKERSL